MTCRSHFNARDERSTGSPSVFLLYNLRMNKRAKKRVKEAIEKDNLERAKKGQGLNPPSAKGVQQQRGFTPKPEKKRG